MSVESYLATVQRMVQWAIRDINRLIARVDMTDPDSARDALQAELPTLISVWGEAAATVAAEYFEELIDAPAVLADPVDSEVVEGMVGWAVGPLYGELVPQVDENGEPVLGDSGEPVVDKIPPDPAKAARNLQGASQRHILNAGRDTVKQSAGSAGVGWARVLQGETNCALCVVMSSRGIVYESAESAGAQTITDARVALGDRYHSFCDCAVIPCRDERDFPPGHDPEALYELYMDARRNADQMTLKGGDNNILTQMRKRHGMH